MDRIDQVVYKMEGKIDRQVDTYPCRAFDVIEADQQISHYRGGNESGLQIQGNALQKRKISIVDITDKEKENESKADIQIVILIIYISIYL